MSKISHLSITSNPFFPVHVKQLSLPLVVFAFNRNTGHSPFQKDEASTFLRNRLTIKVTFDFLNWGGLAVTEEIYQIRKAAYSVHQIMSKGVVGLT
uniref:Uncharacterized protein n=1 Tax=Bubo bubo TaxID=30461 RepID=A0A8C0E9N1_BUBBB